MRSGLNWWDPCILGFFVAVEIVIAHCNECQTFTYLVSYVITKLHRSSQLYIYNYEGYSYGFPCGHHQSPMYICDDMYALVFQIQ